MLIHDLKAGLFLFVVNIFVYLYVMRHHTFSYDFSTIFPSGFSPIFLIPLSHNINDSIDSDTFLKKNL